MIGVSGSIFISLTGAVVLFPEVVVVLLPVCVWDIVVFPVVDVTVLCAFPPLLDEFPWTFSLRVLTTTADFVVGAVVVVVVE